MTARSTRGVNRRDFARLLALTGAAFFQKPSTAWPGPLAQTPQDPGHGV
jgi:hypothetical protein